MKVTINTSNIPSNIVAEAEKIAIGNRSAVYRLLLSEAVELRNRNVSIPKYPFPDSDLKVQLNIPNLDDSLASQISNIANTDFNGNLSAACRSLFKEALSARLDAANQQFLPPLKISNPAIV